MAYLALQKKTDELKKNYIQKKIDLASKNSFGNHKNFRYFQN